MGDIDLLQRLYLGAQERPEQVAMLRTISQERPCKEFQLKTSVTSVVEILWLKTPLQEASIDPRRPKDEPNALPC